MHWREWLGVVAGVLVFLSSLYYLVTVVRGESKPNRVTWFVLTVLGFALLASYHASGAKETIWVAIVAAAACLALFILSLKYGEKGWTWTDAACLVGSVGCIALLVVADSPGIALGAALLADLVGLWPTFTKTYRRPWTESTSAWTVGVIAHLLNVLAVADWGDVAIWSYPVYMMLACLTVAILSLRKVPRPVEAAT